MDRISRDPADVAMLCKHLKLTGVAIVTLADGEISELHVGLKSTMNAPLPERPCVEDPSRLTGRRARQAAVSAMATERLSYSPVNVHLNIANLYRLRIERFTEVLGDPNGGRQAAEALRSLIGEIVLTPGAKRGEVHTELRRELFGILGFANDEENQMLEHVMRLKPAPATNSGIIR